MLVWFVVLLPTISLNDFLEALKRPACWLPLAFFSLVILGMLWWSQPSSEAGRNSLLDLALPTLASGPLGLYRIPIFVRSLDVGLMVPSVPMMMRHRSP
jgi:hypothetical protein